MPLGKQSVAREADAIRGPVIRPVKIVPKLTTDRASFSRLKYAFLALTGSNVHLMYRHALRQSPFPLRPFQPGTDAEALIFGPDAGHVRIERPLAPKKAGT